VVAYVERAAVWNIVETPHPRPKPLPQDRTGDVGETLEHLRIAILE
jgi:hypothetical protein